MNDAYPLLMFAEDHDGDLCLLDAFCEEEGLAFAKLDDIEWRMSQLVKEAARA